jgi:hypothetical protein
LDGELLCIFDFEINLINAFNLSSSFSVSVINASALLISIIPLLLHLPSHAFVSSSEPLE